MIAFSLWSDINDRLHCITVSEASTQLAKIGVKFVLLSAMRDKVEPHPNIIEPSYLNQHKYLLSFDAFICAECVNVA